jgi:hypothetical protein
MDYITLALLVFSIYLAGRLAERRGRSFRTWAGVAAVIARQERRPGLRAARAKAMDSILVKIALGTGLTALGLGLLPGKGWRGGIIAVAAVVAAALILHFVAP